MMRYVEARRRGLTINRAVEEFLSIMKKGYSSFPREGAAALKPLVLPTPKQAVGAYYYEARKAKELRKLGT